MGEIMNGHHACGENGAVGNGGQLAVQEGYITKEEVARRLSKTVRTVENWQRRGYLPFVKIGQSVLFRWSDVVAHLERNFRVGSSRR